MFRTTLNLAFIAFISLSCGKKIQDKKPVIDIRPTTTDPSDVVLEAMKNQRLICAKGLYCPSYLGKVTILTKTTSKTCQGTLIKGNKILMSGSCLPSGLRVSGASCKDNVVVSFVTKDESVDNYECDKVESISSNLRRTTELWDSDIAVLKLTEKVNRLYAPLDSKGINENTKLVRWVLKDQARSVATIFKDSCERITNSYANPFSNFQNSAFQIFTNCIGNSTSLGAPMFNSDGRLVGIQSRSLSRKTISSLDENGLLNEKTAWLNYVSNLVCTDYRLDNDYPRPKDCFERKSIYVLDRYRTDMLNSKEIHEENVKKIEELSSTSKKYFKWRFKFTSEKNRPGFKLQIAKPECMFGIDNWIGEFRRRNSILTPGYRSFSKDQYTVSTKLNKYLQPLSVVENLGPMEYQFKFNPYTALVNRKSYVAFKVNSEDWEYKIMFNNIKECN